MIDLAKAKKIFSVEVVKQQSHYNGYNACNLKE